jgi:hypothetical protein
MNSSQFQQNEPDERERTGETPHRAGACFAQHRLGRVLLHIVCLAHDGKWRWYLAGIRREFHALAHPHYLAVKAQG